MMVLKFAPAQGGSLRAAVDEGRYVIVDFGREGWHASFTATGGDEVAVAPLSGGSFHRGSRHAIAGCQLHYRALLERKL